MKLNVAFNKLSTVPP